MLHVISYLNDIPSAPVPVIDDPESYFSSMSFTPDDVDREMVDHIGDGTLVNSHTFTDVLGLSLSTEFLSTSSKAALIVHHCMDHAVLLRECSIQAVEAILTMCTDGWVILPIPEFTFYSENPVDIEVDGRHFTDIGDFNDYFYN